MSTPRKRFLDCLWIGALCFYILAAVVITPFHGDESTIIFMSRDFNTLFSGRATLLHYRIPARTDPSAQDLRLLNGNLTFLGIGLLRSAAGIQANDINNQWNWGADYAQNLAAGHIPSPPLLLVGRMWSALCTALSTAVMFAVGRRLGGRPLAWMTSLCYVVLPAVLVNGRRANFEGVTLLSISLVLLVMVIIVQQLKANGVRRMHWLLFGAVCGVAMASKHNALLVIAPGLVGLLVVGRRRFVTTLRSLAAAVIVMVLVFVALNPAWWSLSPKIPGEVLRIRGLLLQGQVESYGGFSGGVEGIGQRIWAAATAVFDAPQYYEVNEGWPEWLRDEIARYEASPLLVGAVFPAVVWLALLATGVLVLRRDVAGWLLRFVAAAAATMLILLNPLPWQRYYLPLAPFAAVFCGAGLVWVIDQVAKVVLRRERVRPT